MLLNSTSRPPMLPARHRIHLRSRRTRTKPETQLELCLNVPDLGQVTGARLTGLGGNEMWSQCPKQVQDKTEFKDSRHQVQSACLSLRRDQDLKKAFYLRTVEKAPTSAPAPTSKPRPSLPLSPALYSSSLSTSKPRPV
ncbi:hypothetical protein WMY93_020408 [Mugilogobius chulae]|uniref:Uncharacterized protein n=1 Tax=Mugilogobius chulae TaxID=88201 RepID=A0AAW0NLZ1_9GOBI